MQLRTGTTEVLLEMRPNKAFITGPIGLLVSKAWIEGHVAGHASVGRESNRREASLMSVLLRKGEQSSAYAFALPSWVHGDIFHIEVILA
jgi:hypothetical protein